MTSIPPVVEAEAAGSDDQEDDEQSAEEQASKQFTSLMRVIRISYDNLHRLRHEASSSFVRDEIKTLEVGQVLYNCSS